MLLAMLLSQIYRPFFLTSSIQLLYRQIPSDWYCFCFAPNSPRDTGSGVLIGSGNPQADLQTFPTTTRFGLYSLLPVFSYFDWGIGTDCGGLVRAILKLTICNGWRPG